MRLGPHFCVQNNQLSARPRRGWGCNESSNFEASRLGKYSGDSWPSLFVGNGLSINVWGGFAYHRLYDQATLPQAAVDVFTGLDSTNFEFVLEVLMHTETVLNALGRDVGEVKDLYSNVRRQLFETVRAVHAPWTAVPSSTLEAIGRGLNDHEQVFTTNYDLLPYWALMQTPSVKIVDFFWGDGNTFDPSSVEVYRGYSALFYLHGGIHLWQSDRTGQTGKWVSDGAGLLRLGTLFGQRRSRRPLFVSEGTSQRKLRTIRRSDYLSFALESLREDERDLVIFGARLAAQDDHVVLALRTGRRRRIAVALRPAGSEAILGLKGYYTEKLTGHNVVFFDATTHPLGDRRLTIQSQ